MNFLGYYDVVDGLCVYFGRCYRVCEGVVIIGEGVVRRVFG